MRAGMVRFSARTTVAEPAGRPSPLVAAQASETSRCTRAPLAPPAADPQCIGPRWAERAAIATVQAESGGRAVLGIGRGDSSLAHLGLAPAPVRAFERYVDALQRYLRGDEVEFERPARRDAPPPVDALGLAQVPVSSRLE